MRILIVVHGFPPREPGVWTGHHAHQLAQRHSVWVYTRANDVARPEFDQWEERDGNVTVRRVVHTRFSPFQRFDGFRVPEIDERFLGFVDEIGPDVIHVEHTFGLSATMIAGARWRGVPTVLSLYDYWLLCQRAFLLRGDSSTCPGPSHDFDCVSCVEGPAPAGEVPAPRSQWRLPLHDFRQAVMREALDCADLVTACSSSLQRNLTALFGLPPDRVRTVSLGVPPLAGPVVRQPSDAVRIRFLGSVAEHKGVQVLAAAARGLADLNVEVHMHGPESPQARAELAAIYPSLIFHGPYSREALPAILGATDIQVVPSIAAETFSFVIREAALANVALVASEVGAIPDYITDGVTGLLVPPGDVDALTTALRRLVTDTALRARLATTHAPIRSVADYTSEMEEIYAAVASGVIRHPGVLRPAVP